MVYYSMGPHISRSTMAWILAAVVYVLVAGASAFAVFSGSPFNLVTLAAACLAAGLRTAFMMHIYKMQGALPARHHGLSLNVLAAGVWIYIETALACVLAVYGIGLICAHETTSSAAIGVAFAAFPVGLIQPWKAPSATEG